MKIVSCKNGTWEFFLRHDQCYNKVQHSTFNSKEYAENQNAYVEHPGVHFCGAETTLVWQIRHSNFQGSKGGAEDQSRTENLRPVAPTILRMTNFQSGETTIAEF